MTPGELAAIAARADAATVGPWEVATSRDVYSAVIAPAGGATVGMDFESDANAEFIAHAREDVPALLAVLRERDNTIARVRDVLDDYDHLGIEPIPTLSAHAWMHEVRAALDPQETE
ncbi:hypothetical protein CH305_18310 [Rhodococcus sp. 15-649-2-2]|uniref:hypothetical protein n=1 Tax=Rhodococcus sp. 15-649-2-2 TaxID=2023140 RepID=UPI000B9C754C|nr:hypothetical protein [Rhodococcus sp. 15-649-2-2]OZE77191.1 hypothetical protein CH305_18310 [Rhodococcus sp. 15-649-2-2]